MPDRKQAAPETLMIRLARVAGSVAGTLAAKTAKVVARTESSSQGREPKSSVASATTPKQERPQGKKKTKRAGQRRKRKPNRSTAS
jgi:hypothetical protein